LNDPDPVTRGLAALELRNKGRAAKSALGVLIAKLNDPDVIVRMMSANAIGAGAASRERRSPHSSRPAGSRTR
jgi:hypothetical protein